MGKFVIRQDTLTDTDYLGTYDGNPSWVTKDSTLINIYPSEKAAIAAGKKNGLWKDYNSDCRKKQGYSIEELEESFNVERAVESILAGRSVLSVLEADQKEEKPIKFHGYLITKHPDADLYIVTDKDDNIVCTAKTVKEIEDKWKARVDGSFTVKQIAAAKAKDAWIQNCFDSQGGHIDWDKFNKK